MKLGLMLGYSGAEMTLPVELVQRAEELGFDFEKPPRLGSDSKATRSAASRHGLG